MSHPSWKEHTVGELRVIAKAYKKHTKVGAVSKMKKTDLIAVLDKHLEIIDGMIKVRATPQVPLMGPNLNKARAKKDYAKQLSKAQKKKRAQISASQESTEGMIKSAVAERKAISPPPEMTLEETARAEELKRVMSPPAPPRKLNIRVFPKVPTRQKQMMAATVDAGAIAAQGAMVMQQLMDAEKALAQAMGAVADAMAIQYYPMEETATDAMASTSADEPFTYPTTVKARNEFLSKNPQIYKELEKTYIYKNTTPKYKDEIIKDVFKEVITQLGREDKGATINDLMKFIKDNSFQHRTHSDGEWDFISKGKKGTEKKWKGIA